MERPLMHQPPPPLLEIVMRVEGTREKHAVVIKTGGTLVNTEHDFVQCRLEQLINMLANARAMHQAARKQQGNIAMPNAQEMEALLRNGG